MRACSAGIWSLETLSAGDLTYRLTEDADRIGEVIYKNIQETVPSILQLVVMFGYMIRWTGSCRWPRCCWPHWWPCW